MKLAVEHGSFSYQKGTEVLRDVCFEAQSGDVVAVLGPNGAGKTTLMRCVMGHLKWKRGASLLDGRDIARIPPRSLWKSMAYVPQAKSAQAAYTALELVLIGRTGRMGALSVPGRADVEAAHAAMAELNIERLAEKRMDQMSGGEAQMVLIARALAAQPQILILDEPESNLDFKNQLVVLDAITRLSQGGMACVFNTHYPTHALQRANKALMLDGKGQTLFGETVRVVTEENIQRTFGVHAVIGDIETDERILRDVIPLRVADEENACVGAACGERLAVVSVIAADFQQAEKINEVLHAARDAIVGRMGMPYRGRHVINVTVSAPDADIRSLTAQLARISGVNVKTVYESEGA